MDRSSSLCSTFKTNLSKKNPKTLPRFWARWQEHVSCHVFGDLFLSPWMVHHTCYKLRFICPKDSEIWKIEIVPQKSTNDTVFKVFRVWWRINITVDVFGRTFSLSTLSTFSHQPSPSFNIWFSISGDGRSSRIGQDLGGQRGWWTLFCRCVITAGRVGHWSHVRAVIKTLFGCSILGIMLQDPLIYMESLLIYIYICGSL